MMHFLLGSQVSTAARAHYHYAKEEERVTSHLPETGRITRLYYL